MSASNQKTESHYEILRREWPVFVSLLVISILSSILTGRIVHLPGLSPAASRNLIMLVGSLLVLAYVVTTLLNYSPISRIILLAFSCLATLFLLDAVISLVMNLPELRTSQAGLSLLRDAAISFTINVVLFGEWYWSIDFARPGRISKRRDFLFVQEVMNFHGWEKWRPDFHSYLVMSFYNSVTFGPTDTYILSRRGRYLIVLQVILSLVVILTFLARAFVILK